MRFRSVMDCTTNECIQPTLGVTYRIGNASDSLENHLNCELRLARAGDGGADDDSSTCGRNPVTICGEKLRSCFWRRVIVSMIQNIEELGSELHHKIFRDGGNPRVLY